MDLVKTLYYLALLVLLFVGSGVQIAIGYYGDSKFFSLHPSIYFLLIAFFVKGLRDGFDSLNKDGFLFGICGVIILIGKLLTGVGGYICVVNYVFVPLLFCLLFPKNDIRFQNRCYKILILFFVFNSIMAIVERLLLVKMFPIVYDLDGGVDYNSIGRIAYDSVYFRSNAFLGSPLTNSLCLTAIFLFILMSNNQILSFKTKIWLFIVGFMAVICFNSRTSMILWPVLFVIAVLYDSYQKKINLVFFTRFAVIILFAMFFLSIIFYYNLGDRLIRHDLMDNSANVRLDVIEMFFSLDIMKVFFSFGMEGMDVEDAMYKSGVKIIENPWILYFCQIGGIGLVMVVAGYYKIFSNIVKGYSKFITAFIFFSFLLLGSTNNGLKETAMSIFVVCCYAMPVYNSSSLISKRMNSYQNYIISGI